MDQLYCENCDRCLADRFVEGKFHFLVQLSEFFLVGRYTFTVLFFIQENVTMMVVGMKMLEEINVMVVVN